MIYKDVLAKLLSDPNIVELARKLTDEIIHRTMASIMDYPSVYMGGPSPGNMKRAQKIIDFLKEEGLL